MCLIAKPLKAKSESSIAKFCLSLILFFALFVFTGCSKYQYIAVSSYLNQDDSKEFVFENDTMFLRYSFKGQDFPLSVNLYNKLSKPLYFDVTRSPIYVNDCLISMPFDIDGQVSFIAPRSQVTILSNPLSDKFIDLKNQDPYKVTTPGSTPYTHYSYDENSSPVYIRCILAVSPNDSLSEPVFIDNAFWVSDVFESIETPQSLPYNHPHQFYLKKTTGFGTLMGWVGILSLIVIGSTIDTTLEE